MKGSLFSLMVLAAIVAPAEAQTPGGTLAKIKEVGEIRLGHRDVSVPFSYLDGNQKPVGFAMDLCARIVDAVKEELKLPALQTKLQPIQLSTLPLEELTICLMKSALTFAISSTVTCGRTTLAACISI